MKTEKQKLIKTKTMLILKSILVILFTFVISSCNKEIKSEPKFEFPKYSVSKENFINNIKEVDSADVQIQYSAKSNLISSSSVNKLVVEIYFKNDKKLDESFMKKQFELIKETAKKEILNYKGYDVLELKIFRDNTKIKSFEEVIKL